MGRFPFRRTFEFLSSGNLVLKSNVKTVLINYTHCKESLGLRYAKINFQYSYFRYGKTGDKNVQLVLQHCCKTSWKAMLRVLPPTNQACVACTKQAVPTTGSPKLYESARLRAVSYFSLQSYCTRNLSTRGARPLVARNEGVTREEKIRDC